MMKRDYGKATEKEDFTVWATDLQLAIEELKAPADHGDHLIVMPLSVYERLQRKTTRNDLKVG